MKNNHRASVRSNDRKIKVMAKTKGLLRDHHLVNNFGISLTTEASNRGFVNRQKLKYKLNYTMKLVRKR